MSQLGYDNKCGCRCCEGLDPETNCTTIYRGCKYDILTKSFEFMCLKMDKNMNIKICLLRNLGLLSEKYKHFYDKTTLR